MADRRFAVPLEQLEATSRVAEQDCVEVQPVGAPPDAHGWSPELRFGDGGGPDADGD